MIWLLQSRPQALSIQWHNIGKCFPPVLLLWSGKIPLFKGSFKSEFMINKTWKSDAFSLWITTTPALIVFPSPSLSFMNFFWWLLQAPQTRTDWAQLKLLCLSYIMLTAQNTVIKKLPCNRRELVRIWVEGNSLLSKRWSGEEGRSFSLHVGIYCSLIKKKKKKFGKASLWTIVPF